MNNNRFESQCGKCQARITTNNGGGTWRHDSKPADKHHAYASGDMRQI